MTRARAWSKASPIASFELARRIQGVDQRMEIRGRNQRGSGQDPIGLSFGRTDHEVLHRHARIRPESVASQVSRLRVSA